MPNLKTTPKKHSTTLHVRLEVELAEELRKIGVEEGAAPSTLIRFAVRDFVRRYREDEGRDTLDAQIADGFKRLEQRISAMDQSALIAHGLVDELMRQLLLRVPAPPREAKAAANAMARVDYDTITKQLAQRLASGEFKAELAVARDA